MTKTTQSENRETSIVVLYCQHSVGRDVDVASCAKSLSGVRVRLAVVPCSSKVQVSHLLSILDQEASGVEVIACPVGCCGLLIGSDRAVKRVNYARDL
ncbi:hydrogenase iron-sulfur subunit, partial [Candidatus Latescibacterota bacterium]